MSTDSAEPSGLAKPRTALTVQIHLRVAADIFEFLVPAPDETRPITYGDVFTFAQTKLGLNLPTLVTEVLFYLPNKYQALNQRIVDASDETPIPADRRNLQLLLATGLTSENPLSVPVGENFDRLDRKSVV